MSSLYVSRELKKIYGHSSNITFIFGGRGTGKTYWFKIKALKLALQGKTTVFLRRYAGEAELFLRNFMLDIPKETLDAFGISDVKRKEHQLLINGEPLILVFGLSEEYKVRGIIAPPKPGFVYVDEINNLKGNFLKGECSLLLSIVESFFRKNKVKVFLASNYTLPTNPYFEHFNIRDVKPLFLNKNKVKVYLVKKTSPSYLSKVGLNEERLLTNTKLVLPIQGEKTTEVFSLKYFNNLYKVVKFKNYYVIKRTFKPPKTRLFSLTGNDGFANYKKSIGWFLPNFPIANILGIVRVNTKNELFLLALI